MPHLQLKESATRAREAKEKEVEEENRLKALHGKDWKAQASVKDNSNSEEQNTFC